jgi:tetratricopeptide (TPR) repeat protein
MFRLRGYLCLSASVLTVAVLVRTNPCAKAQTEVVALASNHAPSGVKIKPDDSALAAIKLGDFLFSQRRYQAAIDAYSGSLQMTAVIWNRIGISYEMMKNIAEAERSFRRSMKLEPNNPLALNNLGTIDASRQEYGEAEREIRKALKLDPNFALGYMNLGTVLISERKLKQGQDAYAKAMAIDPVIFVEHNKPKMDNPAPAHDRGAMNYSIAAACARAGNIGCALRYLRAALDEGYASPGKVISDSSFAEVRSDERFQSLLAEQRGS